jgi:hypothetical protein
MKDVCDFRLSVYEKAIAEQNKINKRRQRLVRTGAFAVVFLAVALVGSLRSSLLPAVAPPETKTNIIVEGLTQPIRQASAQVVYLHSKKSAPRAPRPLTQTIESTADLKKFIDTLEEDYALDDPGGDVPRDSFTEIMDAYDEAFFAENSLTFIEGLPMNTAPTTTAPFTTLPADAENATQDTVEAVVPVDADPSAVFTTTAVSESETTAPAASSLLNFLETIILTLYAVPKTA